MKKLFLWTGVGILVLIIVVVVVVDLFLDSAVKKGVETLGPKYTRVNVTVDAVNLSLLSGAGTVKGLEVGNPEGYQTPHAITVGEATLVLKPSSVFSDKVVIRLILVKAPEITLEAASLSDNNLKKIQSNIQSTTGGGKETGPAAPKTEEKEAKPGKKLEVDDFVISDAKLHFSFKGSGQTTTMKLPEIRISDLGTGPEGITSAELMNRILAAVEQAALKEVATGDITKTAERVINNLDKNMNGGLSNVNKSLGDIFKRK